MRRAVKVAETRLAQAQQEVAQCAEYITQHLQQKPACADVLPTDEEVREWQSDHDRLLAMQAEAVARRAAEQAKMPDRMQAVKLKESPGAVIPTLEYVESNLLKKLRGELPGGGWKGGLSSVR